MPSSVVKEVQFPEQPALQLIYDTAPIGLAYLSPDCCYLQINQRGIVTLPDEGRDKSSIQSRSRRSSHLASRLHGRGSECPVCLR